MEFRDTLLQEEYEAIKDSHFFDYEKIEFDPYGSVLIITNTRYQYEVNRNLVRASK